MVGSATAATIRVRRAQLGLWVLVAVSGVWMTIRVSKLWFGGDDWFILLDRRVSPGPGQLGLFEPHFEHWTTVPILVFRAFVALFGVREYWPYVLLLVVVHLAVVVLLWRVMVRAAVDPWLALGFTAVVAVPGVGFENLTNVWQVTLVSSVALGLGAMLLLPERGPLAWRDGVASVLLTVGMACSGVGITMLGVVALVALVRRGWRTALAVSALPAVAYAWWYVAYGSDQNNVTTLSYRAVPGFVWDGLTDSIGDVVRLAALGVVIVLATLGVVGLATDAPTDPTHAPVPGGAGAGRSGVARPHRMAASHHQRPRDLAVRVHHHRADAPRHGGGVRLARSPTRPGAVRGRWCPWSPGCSWSSS